MSLCNKYSILFCFITFFLVFLQNAPDVECANVELLVPQNTNGTVDVAVIITPGAKISGSAYAPLGRKLQSVFPGRLWVALLTDFLLNTPNPLELGGAIQDAREKLKKHGFHGNHVFLAGHSLGGVFVGSYGQSHGSELAGVMLFASYLTRSNRLRDYPTPVLTISGDLDGLTRITRIVDTFEELENETVHNPSPVSLIYKTPVIVMPGINHGHFASGTMPSNVEDHDLPVDVTFDSAYETISGHVTNFIVATIGQPVEDRLTALAGLKVAFFDTKDIIQPLSMVKALDTNTRMSSATTVATQRILIGPELFEHAHMNDSEIPEYDVPMYSPDVTALDKDNVRIQTYTHVRTPFNPEDVSLNPQTPVEVQSIMISYGGVAALLPRLPAGPANTTCKDANEYMYAVALNASSTIVQERLKRRGSPKVVFHNDITSGSKVEWTASTLELAYGKHPVNLDVTSYSLVDENDGTVSCKLLSPYRAMEWLYIDALK